ncbi:amidinotransferase [Roseobacter sp. YSTF-M11]|uniref:Amidinotransferase n=1 Tax=Roseobacter insulae TaxID=2859783 RepID=A0A9X1FVV8_9RHOB|nr:arginine deiminase-related protein [Roseobacter insulae]MBW4708729.1 amidinotransferase [Roseobacter insulae]
MMQVQAPSAVVMIRPHHFHSNPETQGDNAFQRATSGTPCVAARSEFDGVVERLRAHGVTVHDFDDTGMETPDSVFPNNWLSTHSGGHIAVYPMHAANRRRERRWDIIDMLKTQYRVQDVIDYSGLEQDGLALEGTGAMVLDHIGRIAYVARSRRADPALLERFCTHFNFEPIAFDARDAQGRPVYHTNVLMTIGTRFAMVGLEMITHPHCRETVAERLRETGRDVIGLGTDQIGEFAGNAIELCGKDGPVLALSRRALAALDTDQKRRIEAHATLLPLSIPTLETAGGSVRCMIAGLHLARRSPTGA